MHLESLRCSTFKRHYSVQKQVERSEMSMWVQVFKSEKVISLCGWFFAYMWITTSYHHFLKLAAIIHLYLLLL